MKPLESRVHNILLLLLCTLARIYLILFVEIRMKLMVGELSTSLKSICSSPEEVGPTEPVHCCYQWWLFYNDYIW